MDQTTIVALRSSLSNTETLWRTVCLVSTSFSALLFSSVLVLSSISLPSQIVFQSTLKPLNIKVSKPRPTFFSKDWPGQQALAQLGMHWHMLAHTGKRVVPSQWLPSHRGLPSQLQMTALSFSAPVSLSPPLYFTLLQPLSVPLPLSLSVSFYLPSLSPAPSLLIWWRERLNIWLALENTLVTTMCVFLVCECPRRVDLPSNAKRDRWFSLLELPQGNSWKSYRGGREGHTQRAYNNCIMAIQPFIWLNQQ